uniref:Dabb family protein n=1 Tax=Clavibacter michiganensis TaxID=28447 RepID=UPI00292EAA0A
TDDGEGVTERLDALCREHLQRIDGVEAVRSGTSISTEGLEADFGWMLTVRFRDADALAAYLPHPEHRPVADHIGAGSSRVVVFDVED